MRVRLGGLAVLLLALGAGGGAWMAHHQGSATINAGAAAPMAGSPLLPTTTAKTVAPYSPDVDYPPLTRPTAFTQEVMHGIQGQDWLYVVPRDWVGAPVLIGPADPTAPLADVAEVRFSPRDAPPSGTYGIRVKSVNNHRPTAGMVSDKISALQHLTDFTLLGEPTSDSFHYSYRTDDNRLRLNYFRWFAARGSSEATLEVSVYGRAVDRAGLDALFAAFANRLQACDVLDAACQ